MFSAALWFTLLEAEEVNINRSKAFCARQLIQWTLQQPLKRLVSVSYTWQI
jgi:hypothetical protein